MRLLNGCFMLLCADVSAACAGAWAPDKGTGKIIISDIETVQRRENISNFKHTETYRSVLVEYGLSDSLGVAVKSARSRRNAPQYDVAAQDETAQLGLIIDTPALATGLLPPFTYRLLKAVLPFDTIQRQKRAAMTLGLHETKDEFWTAFALGDVISVGRFRVAQQAEYERINSAERDWRTWIYRFTLGYGAFDIGTEAQKFEDFNGTYAALSHNYYVQWKPSTYSWGLRLKQGTSRAALDATGVQKNDYSAIEIEFAF